MFRSCWKLTFADLWVRHSGCVERAPLLKLQHQKHKKKEKIFCALWSWNRFVCVFDHYIWMIPDLFKKNLEMYQLKSPGLDINIFSFVIGSCLLFWLIARTAKPVSCHQLCIFTVLREFSNVSLISDWLLIFQEESWNVPTVNWGNLLIHIISSHVTSDSFSQEKFGD